jgi:ABC-type polysaccharide/polyol phosphate export permease
MSEYLAGVWRSRYFWLSLVKMDLELRYRRSMLGIGWSLLHPIATALVFCVAFYEIFHTSVREYVPFLMAGLAWWGYISGVTIQGCQCFVDAESYIRQHSIPMAVYPLRVALGSMIHFLISLTVVLAMVWYFRGFDNLWALLFVPVSLCLLLGFGWSMAVIGGYINSVFRDIQHITSIAFQALFYMTPIIYPPESLAGTRLGQLVRLNPLLPFLDLIRQPVLDGRVPTLASLSAALLITLTLAAAAVLLLRRVQRQVILYL